MLKKVFLKSKRGLVVVSAASASVSNSVFAQVDTVAIDAAGTSTISSVTAVGGVLVLIASAVLAYTIVIPMLMRGRSGG